MNSTEIRKSFLDFFKNKGHQIVPSASLLPTSPNLLFTNAGMNAFVPCFLGEQKPVHSRIADTQKCIRAGGKHNDLEDVGFDTYHHTLFEMLGNWSFGDYFKEEAITWAWELLTEVWKFPKDRLYATVYQPAEGEPADFDNEAYDIWKALFEKEGMDPEVHICMGSKKDNFWMMGDTGPCGPCSEIHMDLTPKGDTKGSLVNADSPYCIELWNLVFIQFNAEANGTFAPLSAKHVDTGMGFERIAGIMATTKQFTDYSRAPSNYDSDLFTDIFSFITEKSGHTYSYTIPEDRDKLSKGELNDCIFRVIADHIRTLSFSIADGILPGNEGRHYVLRRILRRAVLFGKRLDLPEGFFADLVKPLIEKMGPIFPELKKHETLIHKVITSEEKAFERTLGRGLQLFEKLTHETDHLSGEEAFTLYDTYGFPIDLTQLIAHERGVQVDVDGFEKAMTEQRERARLAQQKEVIALNEGEADADATLFHGYDLRHLENFTTEVTQQQSNGDKHFIVVKETPFYAEMGGQVGDTGEALINETVYKIVDTQKDKGGHVLHQLAQAPKGDLTGEAAILSVDVSRRAAIQRHHSATHLLNWALREILGEHTRQAGSLVTPDILRFDFAHFEAMTQEQIAEVEAMVNRKILDNNEVTWYEVPFAEKPESCQAVFGEKYGAIVRVVDMGGYSIELCGGTHVAHTGEVGLFQILTESAISAGTRRIEAVVGESAYAVAKKRANTLKTVARQLSCHEDELLERFTDLLEERSTLQKELRKYRQQASASQGTDLASQAEQKGDLKWVVSKVEVDAPNDLRGLAIHISKQIGPGVVILGAALGKKVNVVALASPEAIEAGHKAGDIVRTLATELGGKGGGKPDFAMGGGTEANKLEEVLKNFAAT